MSATAASTPSVAVNGTPTSAVDYVRALAPEEKEAVFLALLHELIEFNGGNGLIPVNDQDGRSLGYYVPPKAAQEIFERSMANLPPDVRAKITEPLPPDFDPNDCLTDEELRTLNRQIDAEVLQESRSS